VLDTSVVIDLDSINIAVLPAEVAVTALTMAELCCGSPCGWRSVGAGPPPGPTAASRSTVLSVAVRCRTLLAHMGISAQPWQQSVVQRAELVRSI